MSALFEGHSEFRPVPIETLLDEDDLAVIREDSKPKIIDWYAEPELTIQERFERFDRENPIVYATLVRLAREARGAGARRLGVRTLWEVMRWEIFMRTRDPSGLKLNDHYHSRYVRKLVAEFPDEFEDFFELRKLRAA